jgi:hypothetical protein
MLRQVLIGADLTPTQVDGFPPACARSVSGALFFLPGHTLELTEDEIEFVRTKRPGVYSKMTLTAAAPTAAPIERTTVQPKAPEPISELATEPERVEFEVHEADPSPYGRSKKRHER